MGAGLGQCVGESHQDTALQGRGGSSPKTRVGSLLHVQVARRDLTAGETSLQEMLKGKLLFRHLKGCKARVKCLLDTSTGKKHPRKIQGTALLRHRIRLVTSEHHRGLALRKLSSNNICLHGTKQLISQHY